MSYRAGKWVKKFLIFILSLILILSIFIAGLTFYVNKILTYEKVLSLTQKYSNLYLDRNITFKDYNFNILKGIVLKGLLIEKNSAIANSTDIYIDQVYLVYSFKHLLKFKLFIDKIIINRLILETSRKIIEAELNYYKNKFNVKKPPVSSTNQKVLKVKKEKTFNIRIIGITDSKISYLQKKRKIEFKINDLLIDNEKIKKINKDIVVKLGKDNIALKGETFIFKDNATFNWDINFINRGLSLNLNSQTSNFKDFKLNSKVRYGKKNYNLISSLTMISNKIFIPHLNLHDSKNSLLVRKGLINLKTLNSRFDLGGKLSGIDNLYMEKFIKFKNPSYKANLKLNLLVQMNLKNIRAMNLNGNILLEDSVLKVKNETFYFFKSMLKIKNNTITINQGQAEYKNHSFSFYVKKPFLINLKHLFNISLNIAALDLNKFIKLKEPLPYKMLKVRVDSTLNIPERKIIFKNFLGQYLRGKLKMTGQLDFKNSRDLVWEFKPNIQEFDLHRVAGYLNIKQALKGLLTGKISLKGNYLNKKLKLRYMKGYMESCIDVDDLKNIDTHLLFRLDNNKIIFYDSYLIYNYNKVLFNGTYNHTSKMLNLSGRNNQLFLNTIQALKQEYDGKVDVDFRIKKKLKGSSPLIADFDLTSQGVIYNNLKFNSIKGTFSVRSNQYQGKITVNDFYKGRIASEFSRDINKNFNITAEGKRIKCTSLLKDWNNFDISGSMDFNLNYEISDSGKEGQIKITVTKGEMISNPFQIKLKDLFNDLFDFGHIFYNTITINAYLRDELLEFSKFDILCPDQEYRVSGIYTAKNKAQDILIKMRLSEDFVMSAGQLVDAFSEKEENGWYHIKDIVWKGIKGDYKIKFK